MSTEGRAQGALLHDPDLHGGISTGRRQQRPMGAKRHREDPRSMPTERLHRFPIDRPQLDRFVGTGRRE